MILNPSYKLIHLDFTQPLWYGQLLQKPPSKI